jgi:hypothetical protein
VCLNDGVGHKSAFYMGQKWTHGGKSTSILENNGYIKQAFLHVK